MAAAGTPAAMNVDMSGLVGQSQFSQALQQQFLLFSKQGLQHAATYGPGTKADAPLHVIQQQYGASDPAAPRQLAPGQYSIKSSLAPSINAASAQHAPHAAEQPRFVQQRPVGALAGTAVTGAVVSAPAGPYTHFHHPAHAGPQDYTHAMPQATAVAVKQEQQGSGSPAAHSPTSSGHAERQHSPTPELSTLTGPSAHADQTVLLSSPAPAGSRFLLDPPSPVSAPDPTEGPEAAAEYSRYMERFEEGVTLAQRWHRLSEKGLLSDIVEEWEEWQHDQMLRELQAHNKALQPRQARKHKRDEAEVDPEAPRQSRTRRVPTALQDYQVEAVTGGTPEPPNTTHNAAPAAPAGVRSILGGASRGLAQQQQQQQHIAALEDAEVMYGGGDGMAYAQRTHRATGSNSQAGKHARGSVNAAAAAAAPVHNVQLPMQYNKAAGPQQQYHALQQHQQQQQYNGYANGYATAQQQQQRVGGYPNPQYGQQGAAAAGAQRWPAQQQQQQLQQPPKQQQAGMNAMHGHYQQQQNGYRTGGLPHGGARHDVMNHAVQAGPAYNNNSNNNTAAGFNNALAAGTPVSLSHALAAMAAVMPANIDYATAFDAFSKVMGRNEAAAFTQQFTAAMQQQQAQAQQQQRH